MKTEIRKQVMNYQVDGFNIVHHARYFEMLEEGRWHYCHENKLIEGFHKKQFYHVVINININYYLSATVGDSLKISTELLDATDKSLSFKQVICKNDRQILDVIVTNVFLKEKSVIEVKEMISFWSDLKSILNSQFQAN